MAVKAALEGKRVWWIAPTFSIASLGWRLVKRNTGKIATYKHETDRYLVYPGGGEIWFKSGDDPNNLRGDSLDLVIFDEAAFMKDNVWPEVVMPMLADRLGKAIFISTPNGNGGYFYELFNMGQENFEGAYKSWQFPTSSNPFIPDSEVRAAKRILPKIIFEQEWLAEFTSDGASVFRNIQEICIGNVELPRMNTYYVGGLDWASKNDYSVISVFDAMTRTQVAMERINGVSFDEQYAMIQGVCTKYRLSQLLVEINSIGLAPYEELVKRGLPVKPFETTNESKQNIVTNMIFAMDSALITLLNDKVLISELKSYQSERLISGKWRYAAKGKGHDDTVMATMLAVSLLTLPVMLAPAILATTAERTQVLADHKQELAYRGAFRLSNGQPKQSSSGIENPWPFRNTSHIR